MTQPFEILKQAREQKQLTQQAVADAANIPLAQYQKYETGEYNLLRASMIIVYRICSTVGIDASALLPEASSEAGSQIQKAVLYASFPQGTKEVSAEALAGLASSTIENTRCELYHVIIDYKREYPCMQREEWLQALQLCEDESINLLIIPSIQMLSYHLLDAIQYLRYLKRLPDGVDIYFLYENIFSGSDHFEDQLSLYCTAEAYHYDQKCRAATFRKIYRNLLKG